MTTTDGEHLQGDPRVTALAAELRLTMAQIVRRYRQDRTVSQPQLSALSLLSREGPSTTSQLAALEQVRPQSMAQTVSQMEADGLVERRPDPSDGRQSIIDLTVAGEAMLDQFRRAGDAWVAEAISSRFSDDEVDELERGIELLGRLVGEPPS